MQHRHSEQGAVAMITVIFSVLLLATVSLGFMRLVVSDQRRTSDDELSRGAYDSALAGVEDGKRALQACLGDGSAAACDAIAAKNCNTIRAAGVLSAPDASNDEEVVLQNSSSIDGGFDQAYTCVKISRNTDDYVGSLTSDSSTVIPIRATGTYDAITVSWFLRSSTTAAINLPLGDVGLPSYQNWSSTLGEVRPPIIRAQFMQYDSTSYSLNDFDQAGGSSTLYLYPATVGSAGANFAYDDRSRDGSLGSLITPVRCSDSVFVVGNYVCSVQIAVPDLPNGGSPANRSAYLRLTSIYGGADYMVSLNNGAQFADVEPAIDSTGRASNVFRRVRTRVALTSSLASQLYPRATVDISDNLCKTFSTSMSAFVSGGCDPNGP